VGVRYAVLDRGMDGIFEKWWWSEHACVRASRVSSATGTFNVYPY
jgi:hypothetical protein